MFGNERYGYYYECQFTGEDVAVILGFGVAGAVLGGLSGMIGDTVMGPYDGMSGKPEIVEIVDEVGLYEQKEALSNRPLMEFEITTACEKVLQVYMPLGTLSTAGQDTAVDDLYSHPDQPCGDSKTEIRETYVESINKYNSDLAVKQAQDYVASRDYNDLVRAQNEAIARNEAVVEDFESDKNFKAWLTYGLTGGILGVSGAFIVDVVSISRNRKSRK